MVPIGFHLVIKMTEVLNRHLNIRLLGGTMVHRSDEMGYVQRGMAIDNKTLNYTLFITTNRKSVSLITN